MFSRSTLAAALTAGSMAAAPVVAQQAGQIQETASEQEETGEAAGKTSRKQSVSPARPIWIAEPITVTARGTAAAWPISLTTEALYYDESIAEPSDFQDWITRVPGIGATGQNGLFETFSIRGSGANRIRILAAGVPVTSQRRAGVPLSFVEPYLLGDVVVTRGPSVVHFGPGALGGAVSLQPRWFYAPFAAGSYASAGNEAMLATGVGSESFSVAVARHQAADSEAPNGVPLNTSFERSSATLQFRHRFGKFEFDALLMPSRTEDIGKSNIRFPDRQVTTYPLDRHTIARLRLRHDNGFQVSVYAHDQALKTFKQTAGEPDEFAFIGSTDGGGTVQRIWINGNFTNNLGVEYFTRRHVTGYDAVGDPNDRNYSLDGARADVWSLFAITNWRVSPGFAVEMGGRVTSIEQQQRGASLKDSDTAVTIGAVWTPTSSMRWSLNLASGYRFPALEERFFSGVTGRGDIVGNPNLSSEHSVGADLGFGWSSGDWNAEVHAWRLMVDDIIQKIELDPNVEGYVNFGEGNLYGAEAALGWAPTPGLSLRASGAVIRGENDIGEPLYGIPPIRASLRAVYDIADFTLAGSYTHRWKKTRPGFEELERDAVDILDAEARYHVNPRLDLEFYVRNAFDELYFATADELSTFALERSFGVNLVWTAE